MGKVLWVEETVMIVTYGLFLADKYELPVAYADSIRALSIKTGFCPSTLYASLARGCIIKGKYKVERVIL